MSPPPDQDRPSHATRQELDFFFDPICPWAWITSRWVTEVAARLPLKVNWRFISLRFVNANAIESGMMDEGHVKAHELGLRLLRVAAAARDDGGPEAVGRCYEVFGNTIHREASADSLRSLDGIERALAGAALDPLWSKGADDTTFDPVIRDETELALGRAGRDIGTPVLTFSPPDGPSFFGPIIARIPRGSEAVRLWEIVGELAHFRGFAELKRSLRDPREIS